VHAVLEVVDLRTYFFTRAGVVRALEGLNLGVGEREILGLVGESGSGKSATAYSILRLLKEPGRIVSGQIRFEGTDLLGLPEGAMQEIRGRKIAMIFQNPRASLDPVVPVGRQLRGVLAERRRVVGRAARTLAHELLARVRLPEPAHVMAAYPHELSGGMCQRVMIAMALACAPRLLLADEPTTGLDVTIQYEVVRLLRDLTEMTGMSQVVISHDMGLVAEICDRVTVMYAGHAVETAPVLELFDRPQHPYTIGLLACRPRMGSTGPLQAIPGSVPSLVTRPPGCPFAPRCDRAQDICRLEMPAATRVSDRHRVACYFPGG